jgi:hypothetical protein
MVLVHIDKSGQHDRISSAVEAMEMLATGTTCSFNHSVTTTDAELLRTSIEPARLRLSRWFLLGR